MQPVSDNRQRTDANSGEQLLRQAVMYAGVPNTLQDVAAGGGKGNRKNKQTNKRKKRSEAKPIDEADA